MNKKDSLKIGGGTIFCATVPCQISDESCNF